MPYDITLERRDLYRATSIKSQARKRLLLSSGLPSLDYEPIDWQARLDPNDLMPEVQYTNLTAVSLFSGGGGLDLGFERAGFQHISSIEVLDICGETLKANRPDWKVSAGASCGDVRTVDFKSLTGIDVLHGGPPCQPFSIAGKQAGEKDDRNMWPDFIRAVNECKPRAFVAENVPGMMDAKFKSFLDEHVLNPLSKSYCLFVIRLAAHEFGVPQARNRVFILGFKSMTDAARWITPVGAFRQSEKVHSTPLNTARQSLGLSDIGFDIVAPTLRSGFTGPRKTTGIVNSKASMKIWDGLRIWPNGVQPNREIANIFTPENGHFRLSTSDCALLQGFPANWQFKGAVYQVLGQIGNSVCPPVAYSVARSVSLALGAH